MSTREYAVNLINALSDKQVDILVEFLTNFSDIKASIQEDEVEKRIAIFSDLKTDLIQIPNIDEQLEKDEYFKEKYGL